MNIQVSGRFSEAAFVTGAIVGMLAFGIGLAFLILALSVGMRQGEYLTDTQDLAVGVGGILFISIGIALHFVRRRVPERFRRATRYVGTILAVLGLMGALFAVSAETTVSAPFLVSPRDKLVLFLTAFALLIGGLLLLRGAGKMVGW